MKSFVVFPPTGGTEHLDRCLMYFLALEGQSNCMVSDLNHNTLPKDEILKAGIPIIR